jgi:hypothetical protein
MYLPQLASLALLAAPPIAERADDPRALVRRAIRAVGGEQVLARKCATRKRYKGNMGPAAGNFSAEVLTQAGSRDSRTSIELSLGGAGPAFKAVIVRKGRQQWMKVNGMAVNAPPDSAKTIEAQEHQERVSSLLPLVRDPGFSLTYLGEDKVEGRAVRRVKVALPGKPDVTLAFDTKTALLAQVVYNVPAPDGKETRHELTLSRYREISSGAAEESALLAAGLKADDPSLLAYLKKQVPDPKRLATIRALVKKLGDDDFEEREKAEKAIVALGTPAVPLLNQAVKADSDLEVVRRAERCLKKIGTGNTSAVAAAVRLLALRRPAGATRVLLDVLPGLEKDVEADALSVLASLALRGGKPDPALTQALTDADPARQAAARAILGKDGGAYLNRPGRRLWEGGPLLPTRQVQRIDGQPMQTMEIIEVQLFNRFDDREFEKP